MSVKPNSSINEVPPKVFTALELREARLTWQKSEDAAGCHIRTLRKWRDHTASIAYIKGLKNEKRELLRKSQEEAMSNIANALPAVADSLLKVALSEKNG